MSLDFKDLQNIYATFSEGDKSCLLQLLQSDDARQLTTEGSPLDQFFKIGEPLGWAKKHPNEIDVPNTATWSMSSDGRDGYSEFLAKFYDMPTEIEEKPELATDEWQPENDKLKKAPIDDWQPVNDGPASGGGAYALSEERAPWVKWMLSLLLLGIVAAGAIYLLTIVMDKDKLPEGKVELSSGEKQEQVEAPKSADDEAWVRALEKDTLAGYREYLEAFPEGRYKDKAQEAINKYDNEAWAKAEERNTIAAYEDYLENWPNGLHIAKAEERIAAMKAAIEAQKKDAAERAAAENRAWQQAEAVNTIDSYKTYLSSYPSGKHAPEANQRIAAMQAELAEAEARAIEEAAWQAAKDSNTASAYQTFLASYPNSKYTPLAKAALEQLKPSPGKTFRDCDVCPLMMTVPSGNADLGAKADEPDVRPFELPQRPVIISEPFSIGVTEVTFDQWQACVSAGGCPAITNDNGWGQGKRPIINVSWDNAQKYTSWLSQKTGRQYSLPSEAQWEYAARGGETSVYPGGSKAAICAFGNGAGSEAGLTWGNSECSDLASDRTLPAGSLSPNKFGLKDMIGNVAEWTLDCNTLNLKDAPTNGDADLRGSCNQRVARGGSWFSGPADLRYSARLMQRRGDSNDFTGFRVVRN